MLANVVSIYKKGWKEDPGSYRPGSLPLVPGKVMEQIILSAVTWQVWDNQVIRPSEHGFMKDVSFLTNLISFCDKVTHLVDEGRAVGVVYLEFRKAFVTISHSILLDKLVACGLDGQTFEMLIRLAENYTSTLFCNTYRNMAAEATTRVQEFFTDVGLFIFGTDISTEEFVNRFFDNLLPVVYNHVINPGLTDISLEYAECLRMARRGIRPFGNVPKKAIGQIGRSLLPSRTFLQALNVGIEVINTTDHLHFSKDCSRALLRMQYCPHCQGLTLSKPCMGYCLNVIRGCLANMAEVDLHWRGYILSLEELSSAMSGTYDIEHVLLNFHSLVNDALVQARSNGLKLSEQ
ncbi:PREDICTED: glypican-5-like, partial [Pterocles gutturalis]|uniref:glypican-5-like n=1 Tax=Pterocles gutturalis TaxID=240206 RepID=UPI0005286002